MKNQNYFILLGMIVIGGVALLSQVVNQPAQTFMPESLASPAPRLTPFPTSPDLDWIYIGEFTILDRTVTIRQDHAVTAKAVGTAYPGSVWVIDFPLYQDAAGNVWGKVASQAYWMALKYNGRYFSTWHE